MRFPVRILNQGSNCNEVAASIVLVILAITCADNIAIQFGICWVYRTRVASMEGGNAPPGNILPGGGIQLAVQSRSSSLPWDGFGVEVATIT